MSAPIPAGTWRLVADGIILESVDVTFEILLRQDSGDSVLASFEQHFDPLSNGDYLAQLYEVKDEVQAVPAVAGDQLIFRYTGEGSAMAMAYIPNGDGALTEGRIPFIEFPAD